MPKVASKNTNLTIEQLWNQVGFKPNEFQEKAIRHVESPLYLPAGPGSGKTRVLLWRTVNLVVFHGISPDEILLTTFTEKAALQLKEGLQSYLGMASNYTGKQYDLASMYIGTVHSICQKLLSDRRLIEGRKRSAPIKLMDQLEQYFFMKKGRIWSRLLEAAELDEIEINGYFQKKEPKYPNKHKAIVDCIALFNRFSEERLDIANSMKKVDNTHVLHHLLRMYQEYLQCLKDSDNVELCDLALIQEKALQIIEKNDHASTVFKHIIVDEYQDTNYIQEQLYFKLAGNKNICVVGDDDQALYRFRGSTVENFVEFPARVKKYLNEETTKIPLSINYRSRNKIVNFYTSFIEKENWKKNGSTEEQYRVHDKDIQPFSKDKKTAIVSTDIEENDWINSTAKLCKKLIKKKIVKDPNQIAFLFPSVKQNSRAASMIAALNYEGLNVYAPRAGIFLEGNEATEVFGIFSHIFELPNMHKFSGFEFDKYKLWVAQAHKAGSDIIDEDDDIKSYVNQKKHEIATAVADYNALLRVATKQKWDIEDTYDIEQMRRPLSTATGLSENAQKSILSPYLARVVNERIADEKQDALTLKQIINRITSLDWSLLDLFYQCTGFHHFKKYFDQAQHEGNEAAICNLSKITEYIARFMELYSPILSAGFLSDNGFSRLFFSSYLYTLYRMGESDYEDEDNPFPKGNISLLTIHQSKGLEFPVVFVYPSRKQGSPSIVEQTIRVLKKVDGEPLDRINTFDLMRLFYVGLSRAETLLIVPNIKGRGISVPDAMKEVFKDEPLENIKNLDLSELPAIEEAKDSDISKPYSYTADYLAYERCPRQYMIFRKYGFVPSRSQTMFFGSLVHNTIEDLHHELIDQRMNT